MQYDLEGNLTQLIYPDVHVVTHTWDTAGHQLTSDYDNWNRQHVGYTCTSSFTYTHAGAMTEMTSGNGVTRTFRIAIASTSVSSG